MVGSWHATPSHSATSLRHADGRGARGLRGEGVPHPRVLRRAAGSRRRSARLTVYRRSTWNSRTRSAGRRTHKAYGPEPVPRETLDELFELARWAPNHHLTNPWRFRVLGPEALAALKEAAGPEARRSSTAPRRSWLPPSCCGGPGPGRGGHSAPPPARSTSCCSVPTPAGSPATGARRACCARRTGQAAAGHGRRTSGSWA